MAFVEICGRRVANLGPERSKAIKIFVSCPNRLVLFFELNSLPYRTCAALQYPIFQGNAKSTFHSTVCAKDIPLGTLLNYILSLLILYHPDQYPGLGE